MVSAFAYRFRIGLLIAAALLLSVSLAAQTDAPVSAAAARGKKLFAQDCAFCHGREATGGETGPDLTRSRLVKRDATGDKIREVVREGRPTTNMPSFPSLLPPQVNDLIAFIREQIKNAGTNRGDRHGVDVADLQTGNVEAGKAYFNGPGKCSSCHSPTGDLAGVATRYIGLELEKRMLYPQGAKSKVTVTTSSGETLTGILAYKDEFNIGMKDANGWYRSWPASQVQYKIDAPAEAHAEQFEKYTDNDIHNLMAYLQTLR